VLALFFRNPYAIAVNFKALSGPPARARERGALTLDELEGLKPIASGAVADSCRCRVCGSHGAGANYALEHADRAHLHLGFKAAKARMISLSGQDPLP
jgi:hypothetical protein